MATDEERASLRSASDAAAASDLPRFTPAALLALRALSLCCCLLFTAILAYTCATDGSPFRSALLTPWMSTTLVDYYLTQAPLLLLVALRHRRSPATAALTALYLCCLGSSAVWSYLLLVLLRLRAGDSVARLLSAP